MLSRLLSVRGGGVWAMLSRLLSVRGGGVCSVGSDKLVFVVHADNDVCTAALTWPTVVWPMAYDAPGGGVGRYARPA
eukprot:2390617-Prymnesium_polylepis.1